MFDFEALAYPDIFEIKDMEYKGKLVVQDGKVIIPCSECPDMTDITKIVQVSKQNRKELKVLDFSYGEGLALGTVSGKPDMLTIYVEKTLKSSDTVNQSNFNIGTVSGTGIQIGNSNNQDIDINLQQLVQEIAESDDAEAKTRLKELLENSTVANIIGIGITSLISLL